ncbi:hypothetical protein TNCV_1508591 [Trichonephila clavipes]|nr:hypothetical protein TNCV_1508591 [Trichonephila clavipes]
MISVCSPNYGRQRHFEVCSKLKNVIDADSKIEDEMTTVVPVSTSSEMWNIMKSHEDNLEVRQHPRANTLQRSRLRPHGRHVMISSRIVTKDPSCRGADTHKICRGSMSFCWYGVIVWIRDADSGVIFVISPRLKITRSITNSPRVALKLDD